MIWTPRAGQPGQPLFTSEFRFPDHEREAARDPYLFAQTADLIMASMNQIGEPNNNSVCKFMQDGEQVISYLMKLDFLTAQEAAPIFNQHCTPTPPLCSVVAVPSANVLRITERPTTR